MGIPLLWPELYEHAHEVSLKGLHVFLTKKKSRIRLGIDVSVWMSHAIAGKEFLLLRTIFYRLCKLAALPHLVPIFVFDGFSRPALKRGKKTPFSRTPSGRNLFGKLETQVKELAAAFGFVLIQAPGEAEAELSDLNRRGLIDAILSDDSDCFLFGAKTVVRNWGEKLSGTTAIQTRRAKARTNQRASSPSSSQSSQSELLSSSENDSEVKVGSSSQKSMFADKAKQGDQVFVYRVEDFADGVNAASCVLLIGLLGGGDYDVSGAKRFGIRTAIGLAKGGFDDRLLKGVKKYVEPPTSHTTPPRIKSETKWQEFLQEWKEDVKKELRTNASGNLNRKEAKLANSDAISNLLTTPESMTVLAAYVWPTISNRDSIPEQKAFDVQQVAKAACTLFAWKKDYAQKTFRNNVFSGHLLQWFNGMHNDCISAPLPSQPELHTPSSTPIANVTRSPSKSPGKNKKKTVHGRDLRSMLSTSSNANTSAKPSSTKDVEFEILKERESEVYMEFNIVQLAESVEVGIDEGIAAREGDDDGLDIRSGSEEDELESSAPSETNDTQSTPKRKIKSFNQFDPIRLWFPLEVLLLKEEGVKEYEEFKKRKSARDKVESERKVRQEKKKSFDESQQRLSSFFRSEKIDYKSISKGKPLPKAGTSKSSETLIDAIDNAFTRNSPTASPSKRKAIKTPHASSSTYSLSGSEDEAERTILVAGNIRQINETLSPIQGNDDSVEFIRVEKNPSNRKEESIIILD